jgi:very-short-patch-repair endonuclease
LARLSRGVSPRRRLQRLLRDHPTARGARVLAALLQEGTAAFTRSEAEETLLALLRRGGVPAPVVNGRVQGLEVDFHWPAARVVVEVDGYASHGNPVAFERDRRRDALLVSTGWRVMRLTWRQLTGEPEAVLVRIARALPPPVQ